jgi:hypothetical protein
MHRIREHEQSRRAKADRLVEDARRAADRQIASALTQVQAPQTVGRQLAHRLRITRGLVLHSDHCQSRSPIQPRSPGSTSADTHR